MKNNKGITMIAVIITVVILSILIGVSAKGLLDKDKIVDSTKNSLNYYEKEKNTVENDQKELKNYIINR